MTLEKRRAIESLAEYVRAQFADENFNISEVVKQLDGEVSASSFSEDSFILGSINKCEPNSRYKFEIKYKDSETSDKDMTIAHELGHLFIHMGYKLDNDMWKNSNVYKDSPLYRRGHSEEEEEANEFARDFMMPKEQYISFIRDNVNKSDNTIDLEKVAKHFNVTVSDARIRGKLIGII